jgi:hypothetical protein
MTSQRSVAFAEPVRTAIGTFGGSPKDVLSPPEAKSPRRDDGRGQTASCSVTATITRNQIGRPPPHLGRGLINAQP